jgi:isoamylase
LINAHHLHHTFTLPDASYGRVWEIVIHTADPLLAHTRRRPPQPGSRLRVPARSMLVLHSLN